MSSVYVFKYDKVILKTWSISQIKYKQGLDFIYGVKPGKNRLDHALW